MTCRCTTNTLRLFIRNVAQVDIHTQGYATARPAVTISSRPRAFSTQTPIKRAFSSSSAALSRNPNGESNTLTELRGTAQDETTTDDAFIELTTDAIDQVMSKPFEVTSMPSAPRTQPAPEEFKTPLEDLMVDLPKKKAPKIRTTGSDNPEVSLLETGSQRPRRRLAFGEEAPEKPSEAEGAFRRREPEPWMIEKLRVKEKYPDGYDPLKKLSPDAMEGVRALHHQMPERFTVPVLANEFKVSPEAIRRILKSKWRPSEEEEERRRRAWKRRGEEVWSRWTELGADPGPKWRHLGIGLKPKSVQQTYKYKPEPLPELITTRKPPQDPGSLA